MSLAKSPICGKENVSDLAIFGGVPAFASPLHVGCPNIGDREKFAERLNDIFDRRWLTNNGDYVTEFERRIATLVGVEHCVAMCNATMALEIAIRALNMTGDVIIPSFTFIGTAHALQWQGIRPVFCDIDPRTHALDPNCVEQMITHSTTGIIGVSLWGRACDIDRLTEISDRHRLRLLFDSAHAFGCSFKGRMIGGFGDAEVFSFHATKFVNSLEGGAVVTNSSELAQTMRLMRNFGFTTYDKTQSLGTNAKMNEVSAAMGLTNLENMEDLIALNRNHYQQYQQELGGSEGVTVLTYDEHEQSNYQYVVLEIDASRTIVTRDQLMQVLHAENVLARRYFYPGCHRMEPYASLNSGTGVKLDQTERVAARVLTLPTGQAVTSDDIRKVCEIVRNVLANAREVDELLHAQAV